MSARFMILVFLVQVCHADWSDGDQQQCRNQWHSQEQCMRDHQSGLSVGDRNDIKAKIRACFRNQRCSDPFQNDTDNQAKQRCYIKYRDHMRSDIEHCVQRAYPDYSLPEENDAKVQFGQDMMNMRNSQCRPRDKRTLTQCLVEAHGSRGQGSSRDDYCSKRNDCYRQSRYTQSCYDRNINVRDELCHCTQQAPIDTYKNIYVQCLRAAGRSTPDDHQDYNMAALNSMSESSGAKKFCSDRQDPCGGFQGQDWNQGSNTDFGSQTSRGGIIPNPSLGLGSLLGGNFDISQIFGDNFDLTSVLSNAGGGLFSGGGLPDLSNLFGGRKK